MEEKLSNILYRLLSDLSNFNNIRFKYVIIHIDRQMIGPIPGQPSNVMINYKLYKVIKYKNI